MQIKLEDVKNILVSNGGYCISKSGEAIFQASLTINSKTGPITIVMSSDNPITVSEKFSTSTKPEKLELSTEMDSLARQLHTMLRSIGTKNVKLSIIKKFVLENQEDFGTDLQSYFQKYFELINQK